MVCVSVSVSVCVTVCNIVSVCVRVGDWLICVYFDWLVSGWMRWVGDKSWGEFVGGREQPLSNALNTACWKCNGRKCRNVTVVNIVM